MESSTRLLAGGLIALLALLFILLAVASSQLYLIDRNLGAIIHQHHAKMSLAWQMRHAGRERNMLLHRLVNTEDIFEQDSLNMEGSRQVQRFIQARDALQDSGLSREEQRIFDQVLTYARDAWSAQLAVIDAVARGNLADAREVVTRQLAPLQDATLSALDQLSDHLQQSSAIAEQHAQQALQTALLMILITGMGFLLAGAWLAYYIKRRIGSAEKALHQEKELAEVTLNAIADAVICTDNNENISFINPQALRLLGCAENEALGNKLQTLLHVASVERRRLLYPLPDARHHNATPVLWHEPGILLANNDRRYDIEFTVSPIQNSLKQDIGMVFVMRDISEAMALNQQLSWAATHDALTGLINRAEFERLLGSLIKEARLYQSEHALLYIDLDQFKVVNDTCGHMAGDELLRQITVLMDDVVRDSDVLARIGGDEFGLLLVGCPVEKARQIATQLLDTVSAFRFGWEDKIFSVGMSIGLSPIDANVVSQQELLSRVDAGCYIAKEAGRNRVHICHPDDQQVFRHTGEMQWSQRISHALENNRLVLFSQGIEPLLPHDSPRRHMELLLRMTDENGELISPMSFIPAAERYGMMPSLDKWVIGHTLNQLSRCEFGQKCRNYAINLSGQSLGDRTMLAFIINQIDELNIPPERLVFEITETSAIINLAEAKNFIHILRGIGCEFSLDDFGSGMASFGYLRHLPIDYLKIDGSFIRNICHEPTDQAIVRSINHIGHVMGIQTIAEWVEDEETIDMLKDIGVDYVQGFGVHRPMPFRDSLCSQI